MDNALLSTLTHHYILLDYSKLICHILYNNRITTMKLDISTRESIYRLSDFVIIHFFTRMLAIPFDFHSLYYKPTNYNMFIFEDNGIVTPSMFNKLIVAQVKYNANKQYILSNTEFNRRYFLKFFSTSKFNITDADSMLHCFNANRATARNFLIFVNAYSKKKGFNNV